MLLLPKYLIGSLKTKMKSEGDKSNLKFFLQNTFLSFSVIIHSIKYFLLRHMVINTLSEL